MIIVEWLTTSAVDEVIIFGTVVVTALVVSLGLAFVPHRFFRRRWRALMKMFRR